jgi:hypothetical protein
MSDVFRRHLLPSCLVGLLLRSALVPLTAGDGPTGGDLLVYHETAQDMARSADAWLDPGSSFGYRAPLYFAYLAVCYSVLGALLGASNYHVGQAANLLLFLVIMVLLYPVVRTALGKRVGIVTLWLRSLHPMFVVTDVFLLSEPLFEVFLLLAVWLLVGPLRDGARASSMFLLGLSLGGMVLVREYAQGLIVLALVGLGLRLRGRARPWVSIGMTVLGLLVAVGPWVWRNAVVWGEPTPLALTSGVNLHVGNHPHATGTYSVILSSDHVPPAGLGMGTPDLDRWHRERALRYVRSEPLRFLGLAPLKLGYLVWPRTLRTEILHHRAFPLLPSAVGMLLVTLSTLAAAATWILGVAGLVLRPFDRFGAVVLAFLGYLGAVAMVTFGHPRLADPVILLLLPLVGYAVTERHRLRRVVAQRSRRAILALLSSGLLTVLWLIVFVSKL